MLDSALDHAVSPDGGKRKAMNVERLYTIAKAIKQDLTHTNLKALMQQLISALQNQVNQPQATQHQQQVGQTKTALLQALEKAPSNAFSPSWRQVVQEIGGHDLLGMVLYETVNDIFLRNQITPSIALQELQVISQRINAFQDAIDNLSTSLQKLQIKSEELEHGACEIGILIPRKFVDDRLDKFACELSNLEKLFGTFSEVATGERPGFHIKTLSSSDLTIYFDATLRTAAIVALGIERIVAAYKKLLDIRMLKNELAKKGLTAEELKGVENHADTFMDKSTEDTVNYLMTEFYKNNDNGRKNELSIELRFCLKRIAGRIDRGFNIEVRAEPVRDNATSDGKQNNADKESIQRYYRQIAEAEETLDFIKLEGEPILKLPDSENKDPAPQ